MTRKIIFSLTAHENLECLVDLLINIKKCFIHYDILILLSLTENLYNENLLTFDYVKCVTIRKQNLSIWGNIELFNQQILNIKYIYDNSINYDFFWMVSSNEMFIKIIPPDFLDNNSIKIINKKQPNDDINYDIYFKTMMNNINSWHWIDLAKKDTYFMNYLYKNKFILHGCQHEGMVLSCDIVLEIFNEYNTNKLYENSTFKNYVMEELFISTFLINRYDLVLFKTFCFRYIYSLSENSSYEEIENNLDCHHVSIKPVKRDYHNTLRQHIRNKIT
jgi:hypothetical protein